MSVILPTYNRARWLPETVASIRRQTVPPTEILIVDDGSTDDTEAVCASLGEGIRYVRQANAGVSAARNRGIREAQGEWIALADSDDLWAPEKLEIQLAALKATPSARWCASNCYVMDMDSRPVAGRQGFQRVFAALAGADESPDEFFSRRLAGAEVDVGGTAHRYYHGDFFGLLLHGNVVLPSSAILHRELFGEVGGFEERLRVAEETEFFHRAAVTREGIMVMTPLVGYRIAQEGSLTSSGNTPRLIRNALASLENAVALRGPLTDSERDTYRAGRRRLLAQLAYAELSLLNGSAARSALAAAQRAGLGWSPRTVGLFAATFLPAGMLRGLHRLKRTVARNGG